MLDYRRRRAALCVAALALAAVVARAAPLAPQGWPGRVPPYSILWGAAQRAWNATSAAPSRAPFPHVASEAATHSEVYEALSRQYPAMLLGGEGSNRPVWFNVDEVWDLDDALLAPLWRRFFEYHTSAEFLWSVLALLHDEVEAEYPGLAARMRGMRVVRRREGLLGAAAGGARAGGYGGGEGRGGSGGGDRGRRRRWRAERAAEATGEEAAQPMIVMDCQFRINTPVTERPSRVIHPHVDNPFKLYVGLFYVPEAAAGGDGAGGDLVLYEEASAGGAQLNANRFVQDESAILPSRVVRYLANHGVVFLNTNRSIHGVTPREPTRRLRRMVTLSASLETPIFAAGTRKED